MNLLSFFSKRNKEENIVNPCPTPSDNDNAYATALSDYKNKDKIPPMSISTFFAAVNLVSNSIAMMDWKFKDKEGNELPETNYLYHLFEDSELTRFNTIKNVIQDIIIYGNGFIYIERDKETGRPKTLHYSPAKDTAIWYNALSYEVRYQNIKYSHNFEDGTNYLHFFINTDSGFIGRGIKNYAYEVLDLASTIQSNTDTYYTTTGNMFGIVSPQGELPQALGNKKDQLNKLKSTWVEAVRNKNKGTIFFPADVKYTQLSASAKDTSLIESREYNAVEMGRFVYNLNPTVLGDLRHNSYGTLSEAQKELIIRSFAPITKCIEEECNRKLIMPSKWHKQFVDLDENSILANDQEKQANTLSTLTKSGIMSVNEARKILSLPSVDGGDALIIPYTSISDNTINNKEKKEDKNIEDENNGTDVN